MERNTRDTLSSGERKGKSPNPTSLIAAQMSYEGQASKIKEAVPYEARWAVASEVGGCKMRIFRFIGEELQNVYIAETAGKQCPRG